MKKLAALLAVILTCNLFVGFGASAEGSVHYSNDLNDMSASQWRDIMPTGFTFISDASTWYKIVDAEHGMSFGSKGGCRFKYDFGQTIIGKASFSFDVLVAGTTAGNHGWHIFANELNWDNGSSIIDIRNNNIGLNWGSNGKQEIAPNTWHRVDLMITGTESSAAFDFYCDGVKKGTYTFNEALSALAFINNGNDAAWVFIDNIRAELPADGTNKMTAALVGNKTQVASVVDKSEIRFSDTLDQMEFADGTVEVTETKLSDSTTRTFEADAALDYTATKLEITYNEALNNGCKYSIAVPAEVRGLSGETCETQAVEFTTYADSELLHYTQDVSSMSTSQEWNQIAPSGFEALSSEMRYKVLDSEHGMSWGTSGSGRFKYTLPETLGKMTFSFDMLLGGAFSKGWYMLYDAGSTSVDRVVLTANNNSLAVNWGDNKQTMESNTWHRVDLLINRTESASIIDVYFDGVKIGTRSADQAISYFGFYNDGRGNAATDIVWLDNIRAEFPAGGSKITGALISGASGFAPTITTSTIRFSDTINSSTFTNGSKVEVTETNLATNAQRTLDGATAVLDSTGTKLIVTYNEKLKGNCKYSIAMPEGMAGLSGEKLAAGTTVEVTTKVDLDFYDNFEGYSDWQTMTSYTGSNDFDRTDGAYGVGKAVKKENNTLTYTFPEFMKDGKLVVSFDYKKTADQTKDTGLEFGLDGWNWAWPINFTNGGYANLDYKHLDGAPTFTPGEWNHYDVVFDYVSKATELYQNGVKVAALSYCYNMKSFAFKSDGNSDNRASYSVDNIHVRFFDENLVTTDLDGAISANATGGRISFKDAVDPATIEDNVAIMSDSGLVEFTLANVTPYGADIVFADPLEKNTSYTLSISGVKSCSGETLSQDTFTFEAVDMFEVSSITISDGTVTVTSAASWNKEADYTVTANVKSTRTEQTEICVVVAGYTDTGLVQVQPVTMTVTGNGAYDANLGKLDMKGATKIKCFAVDSMSNLSPLMKTPSVIN